MNAQQIAANKTFQVIAMADAFELLSKNTGISLESLHKQFSEGNQNLITKVAEMVALAAKVTADSLNA